MQTPQMYDASACPPKTKIRRVLTACQAVEIFKFRVNSKIKNASPSRAQIGRFYGVSKKTIRDIWIGRTWNQETAHLDEERPVTVPKVLGRPKGSKDAKKRKCRGGKISHLKNVGHQISGKVVCFYASIDEQLFEWEHRSLFPITRSDPFQTQAHWHHEWGH